MSDSLSTMKDTNFNPVKEPGKLYELMDELGIKYKRTTCSKCLKDYYNICLEELGLIDDASDYSEFNGYEYVYLKDRSFIWKGYKINQKTPVDVIEEFIKEHKDYYRKIANS